MLSRLLHLLSIVNENSAQDLRVFPKRLDPQRTTVRELLLMGIMDVVTRNPFLTYDRNFHFSIPAFFRDQGGENQFLWVCGSS